MLKSDLKPLAPRQKLMSPEMAAVAGAAVGIGVNAAGTFLSQWVWERYQKAKKKSKDGTLKHRAGLAGYVIEFETIEEHLIKTRRQIRVSLKRKL